MNLILVERSKVENGTIILSLQDPRSKHVKKVLKLKNGDNLRVGIVNGEIFRTTIAWEKNGLKINLVEEVSRPEVSHLFRQ